MFGTITLTTLFLLYVALGALLRLAAPAILLLVPYFKHHPLWCMLALALAVGGVVAYRRDVNLAGQLVVMSYLPHETVALYASYRPSLIEWLAGACLPAFTLGARYLNVVDQHPRRKIRLRPRRPTAPHRLDLSLKPANAHPKTAEVGEAIEPD
jgi:Ni/Fe-hydrogenase subunit HybB-like protein